MDLLTMITALTPAITEVTKSIFNSNNQQTPTRVVTSIDRDRNCPVIIEDTHKDMPNIIINVNVYIPKDGNGDKYKEYYIK